MALIEIPINSDFAAIEFNTQLEGRTYNLRFTFNGRMDLWVMDIKDENEADLLVGVPMVNNWPLLGQYKSTSLPPGDFFLVSLTDDVGDASRFDLGERVKLIYNETATA